MIESDKNFLKLAKVADLNPEEINRLLSEEHEKRQLLANRAGAIITSKIRELWTDRKLKIRFNLDAQHFDTLVSDPTAIYDVEVNLDERSRGFKWFFSFYVTFAADIAGGPAENAILLLDEPGLHLHAIAQRNLLDHFKNDFKNQIIFTTHSPFMIPIDDFPSIRTVNIYQKPGTTVTNDPTGDEKTLFPLQTALGYDLTQTLFIGEKNLVVEGVSDFWYLISISDYFSDINSDSLPEDLVITPAGGAQKVSYMVALLTSQKLKVLVLLDYEPISKITATDLIKNKLIRDDNVIFANECFETPRLDSADIEDLIDPDVYSKLVADTYAKELNDKSLNLNKNIPRIVKRYEDAFNKIGIEFHKTRPARLFIRKIAQNPDEVMTKSSKNNFERLFGIIVERLDKLLIRKNKPFI